jgi:hypothetical protein
MITLPAKSGPLFLSKILRRKVELLPGNSTLKLLWPICRKDNQMLLAGMNTTVSGQETLFAFSQSNQDGFTSLLTLFNSTT